MLIQKVNNSNGVTFDLDVTPYTINKKGIDYLEDKYNAKYLFERNDLVIFYQPNPKIDLGHTHYFGIYKNLINKQIYITNALPIIEKTIIYAAKLGKVYVYSHYDHDFKYVDGGFIDGGFSYFRRSLINHKEIIIKDDKFFEKPLDT